MKLKNNRELKRLYSKEEDSICIALKKTNNDIYFHFLLYNALMLYSARYQGRTNNYQDQALTKTLF